jgi:hypothetical protein
MLATIHSDLNMPLQLSVCMDSEYKYEGKAA